MTTPHDPDQSDDPGQSGDPAQSDDRADGATEIVGGSAPDWSSYDPTLVAGGPLPPQAYPGYPGYPSASSSSPEGDFPNPYAEPTIHAQQPYAQQPYAQQSYAQQPYAQQQGPAPQQPSYYQPYPYVPQPAPQAVFASQGPAPQTGQTSSIVALIIGALLLFSCYGTLAGIAPTVLSLLGLTQANSVNRLWMAGQIDAARQAAEESKKKAMWAWISMGIGVIVTIIVVVVVLVLAIQADSGTSGGYAT